MVSKKDRRNSGRVEGRLLGKNSIELEDEIEPTIYWDEWEYCNDGLRFNKDRKHLFKCVPTLLSKEKVEKINKKIKKQIRIRKAKKLKIIPTSKNF
ncbi:MAG: hypothetical protein WC758_07445 [Candidatus Woesearchaeota archaeon]|jgi:hypothetical protein